MSNLISAVIPRKTTPHQLLSQGFRLAACAHRKVEGDIETAVINKWYVTVERMRSDIEKWTLRQSKHASHGWPLVTLMTCLLDNSRFLSHIEGLLDTLHRQLKVLTSLQCRVC